MCFRLVSLWNTYTLKQNELPARPKQLSNMQASDDVASALLARVRTSVRIRKIRIQELSTQEELRAQPKIRMDSVSLYA